MRQLATRAFKQSNSKQAVSFVLLLCFLVAVTLTIYAQAAHCHDHSAEYENCTVCDFLYAAQSLLTRLSLAALRISAILPALFAAIVAFCCISRFSEFYTLVNLKIRINN